MDDGSSYDPSTVTPLSLVFDGTTNEESKLVLDFKSRLAKYSSNYDVELASLGLQVNTVGNVREVKLIFNSKILWEIWKSCLFKSKDSHRARIDNPYKCTF